MDHRLAEVREEKGVKQADLARRIGLSRGQVANLEAGNRKIDLDTLRRAAAALQCDVIELLLPEDAPNHPTPRELTILKLLRTAPPYDPRVLLAAVRAVIEAAGSVKDVLDAPANLAGDGNMAAEVTRRWNSLDEDGRRQTLALLDAARSFRHK